MTIDVGGWLVPSGLGAVAAPSSYIVLLHGAESTRQLLENALPGSRAVVVRREGSVQAYEALANDYPTARSLMASIAPEWAPGTPLVIMGYSAGAYTLRRLLRDAQSRSDVTAAIFLDGLYGAPSDTCDLAPYGGVIEYGKLATQQPAQKRLIMTYSLAHPAPRICSEAIAEAATEAAGVQATQGVRIVGAPNNDHGAQQTVVGPEVVRTLVAPWIGGAQTTGTRRSRSRSRAVLATAVLALGAAGLWFSRKT